MSYSFKVNENGSLYLKDGDFGEWQFTTPTQVADKINTLQKELTALRSEQMTEAKAWEVLGDAILPNGTISGERFSYIKGEHYAHINRRFTSLQLRAIAWWMDNMGGGR